MIDIIKENVTYHFPLLLDLVYHTTGWTTAKLCFKILGQDFGTTFCPQIDVSDISPLKSQRRNSENQIYSIFNPASDSDLEKGVNEKQHHEFEAEYYLHYRGIVYCTEQEFGTFYM